MNLEELKKFLASEEGQKDEVKTYLQGLSPLTVEGMQKFLKENDDAKRWLDSEKDKHYSKGLETWMQKTFPSKLEEEIKKRYPDEDPKDAELKQMKAEIEKMKADTMKKEYTNKALKIAQEKKLPSDLVDYFVSDSEANTIKNLEKLESVFSTHVESLVNERLKSGNYTPPNTDGGKTLTLDMIKSMSPEDINKNWESVQQTLKESK